MKKNFFSDVVMLLTSILVSFFFYSCDKEVIMEGASNNIPHFVSSAEAEKNVMDFLSNIEPSTRGVLQNRRIENVVPYVNKKATRSSIQTSDEKPLFYVVNFADNKGFALAASDDREPQIYAFVESGSFSNPSTEDSINSIFVSNLTKRLVSIREKESNGIMVPIRTKKNSATSNDGYYSFEKMPPLLVTKWGQGGYYNDVVTNVKINNNTSTLDVTGCVPTAIAQICSYLEEPKKIPNCVEYAKNTFNPNFPKTETIDLDWKRIKEESSVFNLPFFGWGNENMDAGFYSEDVQYQIGVLMWNLGSMSNAYKAKDGGTAANIPCALPKLRANGINVTDLVSFDVDKVINDLKDKKIVLMGGFINKNLDGGHAWVVDGYIKAQKTRNSRVDKYIHCNWGWDGNGNGYYLSSVLNLANGPVFKDENDYVAATHVDYSYYYNYELETATFTPKQEQKPYTGIALVPYPHMQDNYEVWDNLECAYDKYYYHEEYVGNYGVRYTSETYTTKKGGTYTLDELMWNNAHILSATVTGCSKKGRMYDDKISFMVSLVVDDKVVGPAEMDDHAWYCSFKITGTPRGGKETDFGEFNVYDEIELPIGNYTIQLEPYQVQEDLDNTPLKIYYPLP